MPVPEHHLITFRGHFGLDNTVRETWSFGLRFRPSAAQKLALGDSAIPQDMVDHARDRYAVMHANDAMKIRTDCYFDECRAYSIGTDGKARSEPRIATKTPPTPGAAAASTVPWQVSCAVTLDAGYPAKGRFGRFYLPPSNFLVDNSGLINLTQAQDAFAMIQTFLGDVSNGPGFDLGWGLVVVGSTGVDGTMRDVEHVRMGRVQDTQRRRRRSVAEAYLTAAFTP